MDIELKKKKMRTYNWIRKGLVVEDNDELDLIYKRWNETNVCDHCKTDFVTLFHKCMDHDHRDGKFRNILCRSCNVSYDKSIYKNNKIGYKNIYNNKIKSQNYYTIEIRKNYVIIAKKHFNKKLYTIEEVVKERNKILFLNNIPIPIDSGVAKEKTLATIPQSH